jgi:NADPH-dependent ferric siderophore reductase
VAHYGVPARPAASVDQVSTRVQHYDAIVLRREPISDHLVRLVLGGRGLAGFTSTGVPDEWVGLVVPGQFQSRYYTVRSWAGDELVLDVVVHEVGLVTEWASRNCVGEAVVVSAPAGSFDPGPDARWLWLVGDLTALPAMARIAETVAPGSLDLRIWAEVPDEPGLTDYLPVDADRVTWLRPPAVETSALAETVTGLDWPAEPGYFWMAGESAQMRRIRTHLKRDRGLPNSAYDVMGYWRGVARRQPRAVDPGPIWRAGQAAGKSDEEIWADYDAARESSA